MTGHSHAIIGASAGVVVAHLVGGDPLAGALLGGVAGLLPDIDSTSSTLGRHVPRLVHVFLRHRGPTHTIAFCAALAAGTYGLQSWLVGGQPASLLTLAVLAGALSHLAADICTDEGLHPLRPLLGVRVRVPWPLCFRTGTWREHVVVLVVVAVVAWHVYGLGGVWHALQGRVG